MQIPDPVVVQQAGGKVVWVKDKGPEHVVFEYWIYCWLGQDAFSKQKELFDRIQACSYDLGSLAIICRNYVCKRDGIQKFHETYLTGPTPIPVEKWNAHHQLLEEAVVDIESFFWFANRLLTHVALTLNYFFKKLKPRTRSGDGVRSHSTLVGSRVWKLLPSGLQDMAIELKTNVSDFRNSDVEHDMKFWRSRKPSFDSLKQGEAAHVRITFPPTPSLYPEKPLREHWILLHDYLTEVAKFLGSQMK
jgi:hypothetical protein